MYSAFADSALAVVAPSSLELRGLLGKGELGRELCRAIRGVAPWQHHLPAIGSSIAQVMGARLNPRTRRCSGCGFRRSAPKVIVEPLGDHLLTSFVPDAPSFWTRLGRPASVCTSVRTGGSLDYARNSVAAGGQPDDGAAARATATQRLRSSRRGPRTQPAGKHQSTKHGRDGRLRIQVEGPHRRSGRGCAEDRRCYGGGNAAIGWRTDDRPCHRARPHHGDLVSVPVHWMRTDSAWAHGTLPLGEISAEHNLQPATPNVVTLGPGVGHPPDEHAGRESLSWYSVYVL